MKSDTVKAKVPRKYEIVLTEYEKKMKCKAKTDQIEANEERPARND